MNTAGCQAASVIVGDHREQARSYRGEDVFTPDYNNEIG
ncbi:hypothetical protein EMIT0P74_20241 [Pseudomonas sp. IT-P74]